MLRESTEPKLNTRVLWILFVRHSVTKVSSIDIFFFRNDVRTKLRTNLASYQVYIRSIKIFVLQFSIKYTINTNPVRHSVTKSIKSIFVLEQLTNVKYIKTSMKIVHTQELKIHKWCTQAKLMHVMCHQEHCFNFFTSHLFRLNEFWTYTNKTKTLYYG